MSKNRYTKTKSFLARAYYGHEIDLACYEALLDRLELEYRG